MTRKTRIFIEIVFLTQGGGEKKARRGERGPAKKRDQI